MLIKKECINKLMLQVIFIFSDWILIKQITISSAPFVLEETDFGKILHVFFISNQVAKGLTLKTILKLSNLLSNL